MHGTAEGQGGAGQHPLRLSWIHPAGLVALSFVNFCLRIITLGIYHFWGKTEVRKRLWSAVRIEGEPLQYTGTGKELFLGFLIVFGAFFLPITLILLAAVLYFGPESPATITIQLLFYVVVFGLIGVGIYRAQKYRLSRTTWRGIRGALVGSGWQYGWTYFWTAMLIPMTFGWIAPWRSTTLQKMMAHDMRFGDKPFRFTATPDKLYGRFAIFWCMAIVILIAAAAAVGAIVGVEIAAAGDEAASEAYTPSATTIAMIYGAIFLAYILYAITSAWYRAFQINYFAEHTHLESARFKSDVTARGLIWIGVTNILIVLLSLTILTPVAQARMARYLVEHTRIEGTVPLGDVQQGADQGLSRGEGLAQAFDIDGGF